MANYTYTAKPARKWTRYDLDSYNITLIEQPVLEFFAVPVLPDPPVDAELLENLESKSMKNKYNTALIGHLDLLIRRGSGVVDFAIQLFKATGYVGRTRLALGRNTRKLRVYREYRDATPDVCVIDHKRNDILVLLQEEKHRQKTSINVPAQLVAKAVAAVSEKNTILTSAGLAPLQSKDMPGIVMTGAGFPTFFKIPISQELISHVEEGTYPPTPTIVTFCFPPVARPDLRDLEGMKPLDNRREIFRCYEAFKTIVGI